MIGSSPIYNVRVQVKLALRERACQRGPALRNRRVRRMSTQRALLGRESRTIFLLAPSLDMRSGHPPTQCIHDDRFSLRYAYVLCDVCATARHPPVCNQYPPSIRQAPSPID